MTMSDRPSPRVFDIFASNQVDTGAPSNKGTDGIRHSSTPYPRRIGQRQLTYAKSQLSDREVAVLESIGALHFVTTQQLQRLHFNAAGRTPMASARATSRTLRRLHEMGLVERLERRIGGVRAGSSSFILRVNSAGARLLGRSSRQRSFEPSLAHLAHVLDVAELVVRIHEAEVAGDCRVVLCQLEPACWRTFAADHGGVGLLKPDLRVTVAVDIKEIHWFIEIDRGTEHRRALARKVALYVGAWRDGSEQAAVGVFPKTLWVVPDQKRAEALIRLMSSLSDIPMGMFEVATGQHAVGTVLQGGPS